MKLSALFNAIGFGCLLCGSYKGDAQPLIYSTPIVVQLADVDRSHLYVHPRHRILQSGYISLFFKDLDKSKVHQIVQYGVISHNSVWVMDGKKLLVQCSLAGQAEFGDSDGN